MSKLPRTTTVASLVKDWEDGNLSRGSLASLLLCCADLYEPNALLDAVPVEHRADFAERIRTFPLGGSGLTVGRGGVDPPSDERVTALQKALAARPDY